MKKRLGALILILSIIVGQFSFAEFNFTSLERMKNEYHPSMRPYYTLNNDINGTFNIDIPIKIWYKGQYIYGDSNAVIKNDRTQVPVRFMSLAFGYNVAWDNDTKTITLNDDNANEIKLQIGSNIALVNGVESKLDNEVFANEKGRSYVPLRFVSEAFSKKVDFDSNAKVAVIGNGYKNNEYYPVRFFYGSWEDKLNQGDYLTSEKINFTDLKPSIMWGDEVAKTYNTEQEFMEEFFSKRCGHITEFEYIDTFESADDMYNFYPDYFYPLTCNECILPRKFNISDEYIPLLDKYFETKDKELKEKINECMLNNFRNNVFASYVMPGDYVTYDINNLPLEMRVEFAYIGADLINSIREKKDNSNKVKVSKGIINFADDIAKVYLRDNWGILKMKEENKKGAIGHDAKGINEIAKKYGLKTTSKENEQKGRQFYENATLQKDVSYGHYFTKGFLKNKVVTDMMRLVFELDIFGHAIAISGIGEAFLGIENEDNYFAVAFSYIENTHEINTHFIDVTNDGYYIKDKSKFDTTIIEPSDAFKRWRYDKK